MVKVLFICVHNAGRSQMAEAIFNQLAAGRHQAKSAGSSPADSVNPVAVQAMKEIGIEIGGNKPKQLDADLALWADIAVTMGCGDECPVVVGDARGWDIDDPKGQPLTRVREIRDQIKGKVESLLAELDGDLKSSSD